MKLHAHRDVRSHFAEVLIADREEAMALFPLSPLLTQCQYGIYTVVSSSPPLIGRTASREC